MTLTAINKTVKKTAFAALLLPFLISGCSSSNKSSDLSYPAVGSSEAKVKDELYSDYYDSPQANVYETSADKEISEQVQQRKIIKNATFYSQTSNFDDDSQSLTNIVYYYGGYIENSELYTNTNNKGEPLKTGNYTFRLPSEDFDKVVSEFMNVGSVKSVKTGSDDVTEQYYDIAGRLTVKEVEEQRILEIMKSAKTVSELIELESRLSDIRRDIEYYKTRLNTIDKTASYSTIYVTLNEVKEEQLIEPANVFARMKASFKSSVEFMVSLFQGIIVFLAGAIIPVISLSAVIFVVFLIYLPFKKNKNKNI